MEIFKKIAAEDKRSIWTSDVDFDVLDTEYNGNWEEYFEDQEVYLGDEKMNLDIRTKGCVMAFAANSTNYPDYYGRGIRYGHIALGHNINSIFDMPGDDRDFYFDGENVRGYWVNHDWGGVVIFRAWRAGISEAAKSRFLDLFGRGLASYEDMKKVTRSIGPDVAKVYGWKIKKAQALAA